MTLHEMEQELNDIRREFREALEKGGTTQLVRPIISKVLDKFAGTFEEETVKEVLREEYLNYMEELLKGV